MFVRKIEIDHQKCTTPYACKICLQACPQAVLTVWPMKMEKFKETDPKEPGAWKLSPNFADKCTGCNECVELCPVGAITLVYNRRES
jgi:NADH-quinone oxidoreductase subunit I